LKERAFVVNAKSKGKKKKEKRKEDKYRREREREESEIDAHSGRYSKWSEIFLFLLSRERMEDRDKYLTRLSAGAVVWPRQ
jgi:hypothetical protein